LTFILFSLPFSPSPSTSTSSSTSITSTSSSTTTFTSLSSLAEPGLGATLSSYLEGALYKLINR